MLRWPSRTEIFDTSVALVVGSQVLINVFIALTTGPGMAPASPDISKQVLVWLGLSLGPLCAPIVSFARDDLVGVAPMIVLFTSPCALLLASALARRSAALFLLLDLVWFAFGFLFTIAIWV